MSNFSFSHNVFHVSKSCIVLMRQNEYLWTNGLWSIYSQKSHKFKNLCGATTFLFLQTRIPQCCTTISLTLLVRFGWTKDLPRTRSRKISPCSTTSTLNMDLMTKIDRYYILIVRKLSRSFCSKSFNPLPLTDDIWLWKTL